MPIRATPSTPPRPLAATVARPSLEHVWTGWDGSEWRLTDPRSGVRLLRGYRGVSMPAPQRFTSTSPALDGTRHRGRRLDEREVFWPLLVYTPPAGLVTSWSEYDDAFWRTMQEPGEWAVTDRSKGSPTTRRLRCRFISAGDGNIELDPTVFGWARYQVSMVAEQPYWVGDRIERGPWGNSLSEPFHSAPGDAFVVSISSGSTLANARIPNPGDVEVYPRYIARGPITTFSAGIGDDVTEYVQPIPDGETRIIDTSPSAQTVVDQAGNDRIDDLGQVAFNTPIPPGGDAPLTLNLVGQGTVSVSIDPLYYRGR